MANPDSGLLEADVRSKLVKTKLGILTHFRKLYEIRIYDNGYSNFRINYDIGVKKKRLKGNEILVS